MGGGRVVALFPLPFRCSKFEAIGGEGALGKMLVFFSGHGTPWYLTLFIFAVSLASQGLDLTFFPYSLFGGPFIVSSNRPQN